MRRLLDLPAFGALLLAELVMRSLPPRVALGVADAFSMVWYALARRRRGHAFENVALGIRAGVCEGPPRRLVRAAFRSLGRVAIEAILFPRYLRGPRDVLRRCRFFGDWQAFHADVRGGSGGLMVGGHLGSWELAPWGARFLQVPTRVVVRPIENRLVDRRAVSARGGPSRVIRKVGAVGRTLVALREGAWVAILADQNAGRGGVFVPFLGIPASTYGTPAVLAARAGVPLYVGASLRRAGRPFQYDAYLRRVPPPPEGLAEKERVRHVTASVTCAIESWLRMAPEQYNWIHRRWKARPAGEERGPGIPYYPPRKKRKKRRG